MKTDQYYKHPTKRFIGINALLRNIDLFITTSTPLPTADRMLQLTHHDMNARGLDEFQKP